MPEQKWWTSVDLGAAPRKTRLQVAVPQVGKHGQKNRQGAAVSVWSTTQFEESRVAAQHLEILSVFYRTFADPSLAVYPICLFFPAATRHFV